MVHHRCSHLLHGVKLSILQQSIVFKHYFSILSQKLIRVGRRIRFAIVRKVDEHHWLSNPATVSKIACYLASASRSCKHSKLPLIFASYHPGSKSFFVSGVSSTSEDSARIERCRQRITHICSRVGTAFRQAALSLSLRVKHDFFEPDLMEIHADDLKIFIQKLQTIDF